MTTDTPLLELSGINKSFGPVHVLRDVDLEVYAGKVTALVGDNGAGKSTLIKGIAGIYPFDSGEYFFEGRPAQVHDPKQANDLGIEVVYQDLALCPNLSIADNLALGQEPRHTFRGIPLLRDNEAAEREARARLDQHAKHAQHHLGGLHAASVVGFRCS